MPRDATDTREALIRAGERRFAADGIAGARLADIVRDAGQGNDSAVGLQLLDDVDLVRVSRERLVDGVVDDFVHEVMEAA